MLRDRLVLLTVVAAVLLAGPRDSAADTFGMNGPPPSVDAFEGMFGRPPTVGQELASTGTTMARADASWYLAESERGTYDWDAADRTATYFAARGLTWTPTLAYSPLWSTSVGGTWQAPPANTDDFVRFAGDFAARYGSAVQRYEMWNEPNLPHFWRPGPDPARYADMYVRARVAIRQADPGAAVIVGGLAPEGAATFLRAMYAGRADLRGNVDGVGVHPYSRSAVGVLRKVREVRRELDALGEVGVPINVTELGWPTAGTADPLSTIAVPDPTRAANLALATDALLRSDCGVASVEPFAWVSREMDPAVAEDWLGIYSPARGHSETSREWASVVRRFREDERGSIAYCGRVTTSSPLRLRLTARRNGRCVLAAVAYRGNPVYDAKVTVRPGGRARAGKDGRARVCGVRTGARVTATADLEGVATSRPVRISARAGG